MTEDEMAGWHHWLDGHESEWTLGFGDGQGGLACCDSWGRKESDTTERLIWSDLKTQSLSNIFVIHSNWWVKFLNIFCFFKSNMIWTNQLLMEILKIPKAHNFHAVYYTDNYLSDDALYLYHLVLIRFNTILYYIYSYTQC